MGPLPWTAGGPRGYIFGMRLLLLLALLFGCEPEPDEPPVETPCSEQDLPRHRFELTADAHAARIHPQSVLAGNRIWTVYNAPQPDGSGDFATFVVAHDCSGTETHPPTRLTESPGNQTDPAIALSGDRMLVAWQVDAGGSPNLSIHTAVLGLGGGIVRADRELAMQREGELHVGNAWMPRVAALPDGFALAGSRGVDNTFQAFVQRLDVEGEADGESVDLFLNPGFAQLEPTVVTSGRDITVAWSSDLTTGEVEAWRLPANSDEAIQLWTSPASGGVRGASLGSDVFIAAHEEGGPGLMPVIHRLGTDAPIFSPDIAVSGHTVGLAAGADDLLFAWHQGTPTNAELFAVAVDASGVPAEVFEPEYERQVVAYPADVAAIGADGFFISWVEGEALDYQLFGQFIRAR